MPVVLYVMCATLLKTKDTSILVAFVLADYSPNYCYLAPLVSIRAEEERFPRSLIATKLERWPGGLLLASCGSASADIWLHVCTT